MCGCLAFGFYLLIQVHGIVSRNKYNMANDDYTVCCLILGHGVIDVLLETVNYMLAYVPGFLFN